MSQAQEAARSRRTRLWVDRPPPPGRPCGHWLLGAQGWRAVLGPGAAAERGNVLPGRGSGASIPFSGWRPHGQLLPLSARGGAGVGPQAQGRPSRAPPPPGRTPDEPLCLSLSFLRLAVGIKEPSGDSGVSHCPIEHPLPSAPRVFHVLFGTDRKPFHCFTTWILALMKEALHQIIGGCRELLSSVRAPASSRPRAPRPRRQLPPRAPPAGRRGPGSWAAPAPPPRAG